MTVKLEYIFKRKKKLIKLNRTASDVIDNIISV